MHQDMNSQLAAGEAEGSMAKADLYRAAKHSMKLFQMIQDGQQLEGWVQAKITKAADYLDSIYHYMEYQVKFGSGAQVSSVQDITGDMETAAEVAADEDNKEEMEESMNYEQKLKALLESAVKKAKKDYDGDGKIETGKDEYLGSKIAAAKKAGKMKEGTCSVCHKDPCQCKDVDEGFEAGAKPGSTFKTAKGTATKTATGLVHKREKYDYDPGSDDKEMSKVKRDARNKKVKEGSTGGYSAKDAAAGKDLGKPGKNFAKIAKKSGGGEKGKKIAGAVLAKLRKG